MQEIKEFNEQGLRRHNASKFNSGLNEAMGDFFYHLENDFNEWWDINNYSLPKEVKEICKTAFTAGAKSVQD